MPVRPRVPESDPLLGSIMSMTGASEFVPSSRRPRWRRRTTLLAAGLAVLAVAAALVYRLRDPYRIEVDNAIAWDGAPLNTSTPPGAQFDLSLHNPRSRALASARVVVENWRDDTGRDLTIREVPAGSYRQWYGYQTTVGAREGDRYSSYGGSGTTAPQAGRDPAPAELTCTCRGV
jgi:hypothetical protein